jgi:hypothetical protein
MGWLLLLLHLAVACSGGDDGSGDDDDDVVDAGVDNEEIDLTRLPIGGDYSDSPEIGSVFLCSSNFMGGGATAVGPWIDEDGGTFDVTAKYVVDGNVEWESSYSMAIEGDTRIIISNGLPDHATGTYPVAMSDDAFAIDPNPNGIMAQDFHYELPANPVIAAEASCVPWDPIVLFTSGVVGFHAIDAKGKDAVAYEIGDSCGGHPRGDGMYHYHYEPSCMGDSPDGEHSKLLGWALDGFGFFGPKGEGGETLRTTDLDECHGHTHEILWDGAVQTMYHYHFTWDYPYYPSCFRGEQP